MGARSLKPVGWIKKHWVKIVVAIIVIGVLYWLFGSDVMEGATGSVTPKTAGQIEELRIAYLTAENKYKMSLADYNDTSKKTYVDRDGTSISGSDNCSKTAVITGGGSTDYKYDKASGCKGHLDAAKKAMDDAWTAYAPYEPVDKKKKKKRSLNSRIRRFFGMR